MEKNREVPAWNRTKSEGQNSVDFYVALSLPIAAMALSISLPVALTVMRRATSFLLLQDSETHLAHKLDG